jgi:hypothetical protein
MMSGLVKDYRYPNSKLIEIVSVFRDILTKKFVRLSLLITDLVQTKVPPHFLDF